MPFIRDLSRRLAIASAFAVLTTVAQAAPSISIGTMFDYLGPSRSTLLKQVRNSGDTTAFVRISVSEIEYGEAGATTEHPVDTRRLSAGIGVGLIASPARLIVPAGGIQSTRLLFRGTRDKERHYRVRFVPVLPEAGDEFLLGDEERERIRAPLAAGVSILTGYGGIVIVRPDTPRFDTRVDQGEDRVVLRNEGNSTVVLDALTVCDASKENCTAPSVRHVRPGGRLELEKQSGHGVLFTLLEGDERREMHFW
ncbi:hypothetical protein SAMN05428960_2395 [Mitsuaria sp. PDC51]|uniref:hypothetical protein n=1 Tax=unclassified Roseateles TaxID=2626991 RepID=UPI0008E765DA|nr:MULTISPECIES: hypothetical protein [unclassified Roseateles]MBB3294614.1 P pilus assembly chaperone PapD [Mitsuaria sp. BK041]MBB3363830.1 P pilus assembly chaperone PapD [Mitsuaria sp. BK045]SFR86418.1 hypothetical protein SAMN05428960_2395 [Mitsuaria sp. PDC51]